MQIHRDNFSHEEIAIRNNAQMHEVCEFAGHSDIPTTELYFVRKVEDGGVAARRIPIRATGRKHT
jgi:hypothetical protein